VRILIYSHYFHPSVGGVEKTTLLLARYLSETGHETTVITQTPSDREDAWSFRVVRTPRTRELLSLIRQAEVVQIQGFVFLPFFIAKVLGRPVVWAHHGYDITCPKQIGWNDDKDTYFQLSQCMACLRRDHSMGESIGLVVLLAAKRFFKGFADAHVAPSHYLLTREALKGIVIPNPVDAGLYTPSNRARETGKILFMGRLIEEKGVDVLIDAMGILAGGGHDYSLEIVGTGHKHTYLRNLVRAKGLEDRISFSPPLFDNELVDRIQRASVVAAPTISAEAFGMVGIEAMSCETPLVATRKGGFPEFAEGVAWLVPTGDAAALAEALENAITDNGLSGRLHLGRLRILERYDFRKVGESYIRLYETVLSR